LLFLLLSGARLAESDGGGVIPTVLHNGSSEFLVQSTVGFSSAGLHDGSFGFLVQSTIGVSDVGGAFPEGRQSPLGIQSVVELGRPGSQGMHVGPKGTQPPVGEKTRCDVDGGEVVLLLSFTVDGGCSIVPGTVWELPLGGATEGGSVVTTGGSSFGGTGGAALV
jgi:hypothetical protein